MRKKWADSLKVHEREGEKWYLKKPLGTWPRKMKGHLGFQGDDVAVDIIIYDIIKADLNGDYFALLQLIVKRTQVLSPRNWKIFSAIKNT